MIVNPGGKSLQSLERCRGLAEPCGPFHYRVEPGDGSWDEPAPEFFPRPGESGLKGVEDAISRAAWLSMANPPQRVVRVRPDDAERVIRWYRGGSELSVITNENRRQS
jgi:hypothetical protein